MRAVIAFAKGRFKSHINARPTPTNSKAGGNNQSIDKAELYVFGNHIFSPGMSRYYFYFSTFATFLIN